jgi:hypothetical protein
MKLLLIIEVDDNVVYPQEDDQVAVVVSPDFVGDCAAAGDTVFMGEVLLGTEVEPT